jgi:hypothetical protein
MKVAAFSILSITNPTALRGQAKQKHPVDAFCEGASWRMEERASNPCDPNPVITYSDEGELDTCGVITRTWTATDACGNSSSCVQTIIVKDDEPPVINCPYCEILVGSDPNTCESIVDFDVEVSDNCSDVTITYSNEPGSLFPTGTTIVTVTAEDACGNTSTCEFEVTVVDNCNLDDCCDEGNKPAIIGFVYTGDDCTARVSLQDSGKFSCDDTDINASLPDTVYIIASSSENGGGKVWFTGTVTTGDTYTISASNVGETKFDKQYGHYDL